MVRPMLPVLAALLCAGASVPAAAHDAQLWFNTTLYGSIEDFAFFAEVQPRFGNDISKLDQFFFRPAVGWKVNQDLTLYQGYAYVEDRGMPQVRIEDRSFQEINWKLGEINGLKTSSRTRFEQRWRSDGKDVAFRVREQMRVSAPLTSAADSVSALGWTDVNGTPYPSYVVRHADSADGVKWSHGGPVCISHASADEFGIGRPWVVRDRDRYRMWFASNRGEGYRIGYAESDDGLAWHRVGGQEGLDPSASGWDSRAVAYPWVIEDGGRLSLLYNGNDFGREGFGLAVEADG